MFSSSKGGNSCKMWGWMALNTILTLAIFIIIVNFAPRGIANIFLNPLGVVQGLQYEQEMAAKKDAEKANKNFKSLLESNRERIFDKNAPFIGAKDAKVEIVIFADYKCVYCKHLADFENNIISDPKYKDKVKFIMIGYPILSQVSGFAAVAAIQAFKQDPENFAKIHKALYVFNGNSEAELQAYVKAQSKKNIKINFEDAASMKQISNNLALGRDLNIQGTPGIIIGDEYIGGLIPESDLRAKIDALLAK